MSDDGRGNWRVLAVVAAFGLFVAVVAVWSNVVFSQNSDTYPRLAPWEVTKEPKREDRTISVRAVAHACVRKGDRREVSETFDRVEVAETADTITIKTWLGPPDDWGFARRCANPVGHSFLVRVELGSPLGDRTLIDPACELEGHARKLVCSRKASSG